MEGTLRRLLEEIDDPDGCEVPGGNWTVFPYQALSESIQRIQEELRSALKLTLQRDAHIEDASFHDELRVLHPTSYRENGVVAVVPEIAIRFSNFGRLYTIYTLIPDELRKYPLDRIRALIDRHGWTYVPAEALDEVYDGKNAVLRDGKNTWWIRFFDYL